MLQPPSYVATFTWVFILNIFAETKASLSPVVRDNREHILQLISIAWNKETQTFKS